MIQTASRPFGIYILFILLAFQGLSGIFGGMGLVLDPTGESLQLPVSWLDGSPFSDYLIPGLILLAILGIFPLMVSYSLWIKHRWSWFGALIVGAALLIWIGVEILMIGYQSQPPLQLIYGLLGFLILIFSASPTVKEYLW